MKAYIQQAATPSIASIIKKENTYRYDTDGEFLGEIHVDQHTAFTIKYCKDYSEVAKLFNVSADEI